jgi:ubiquinone/menaquinone biosynthesis C-methylase UbiE
LSDFSNFLDVQTKTAWGRTLAEFATFCNPSTYSNPRPELVEGRRSKHVPIVLDIGCGPGLLPALFANRGCKVVGVDFDHSLLAARFVPTLVQADAFKLPLPAARFDMVTATNILFLLADPEQALREWKRVLVPGGMLCLLNPSEHLSLSAATRLAHERGLDGTARESLLNWAQNAETHFRWTESEMRELLSRAGFRLEESVLWVGPGFARFTRAGSLTPLPFAV